MRAREKGDSVGETERHRRHRRESGPATREQRQRRRRRVRRVEPDKACRTVTAAGLHSARDTHPHACAVTAAGLIPQQRSLHVWLRPQTLSARPQRLPVCKRQTPRPIALPLSPPSRRRVCRLVYIQPTASSLTTCLHDDTARISAKAARAAVVEACARKRPPHTDS